MDSMENTGPRQQSRIPYPRTQAGTGLQEMTETQHNSRTQASMMRPPAPTGIKRPGPELQPQPEAKRQTLVERAADYNGKKSIIGSSATAASAAGIKGSSIATLASKHQTAKPSRPVSSLAQSMPQSSNAHSNVLPSNSLLARSIGPGVGKRAAHATANQIPSTRRRPNSTLSRPATSAGQYSRALPDDDQPLGGKQQNGMVSSSLSHSHHQHTRTQPDPNARAGRYTTIQPEIQTQLQNQAQIQLHQTTHKKAPAMPGGRHSSLESVVDILSRLSIHHPVTETAPEGGNQAFSKRRRALAYPEAPKTSVSDQVSPTFKTPDRPGLVTPFPTRCIQWQASPQTPVQSHQEVQAELAKMEDTLSAVKSRSPGRKHAPFMSKYSNMRGFLVLDVDERLREVESQFYNLKDVMNQSLTDRKSLEDVVELAKNRANDLERQRDALEERVSVLRDEADALRQQLQSVSVAIEGERRDMSYKLEDQAREHRRELEDVRKGHSDELQGLQRSHREALEAVEREHKANQEEEKSRALREILDLKTKLGSEQQDMHLSLLGKDRELQLLKSAQAELQNDLDRERSMRSAMQTRLAESASANVELEERARALQAQVDFLQSDSKQQSDQFAEMEARMQQALKVADEARQKLIKEETERRILFNKYQELKGNIRVMCRVRPALGATEHDEPAKIAFPDENTSSSQIDVAGPEEKSSLGVVSRKTMPFEFDRVFAPNARNEEVFDEISQLVQSALDGYNVCIFCYGQTGSGKTYTMSSPDGMIPRATHMIYDTVRQLEEKSWAYTMEGSFVEVYNEELHDLLGNPAAAGAGPEADTTKKKLEIRHDETRKATVVTNCKTVRLDSADKVESMLRQAQSNRSVAATKSNERSSRSHSVFMLKLAGENRATGERCEGTLNLVDLAGSERLKQSGAEGDRKRETQSINKSLACLGDVIEALGRGAPHIPYRNSKLTHLLQYSLGGNSKTLMFVMVSPLEAHLKETLTSLRFATKVHNTHIGTAKSTKKIKD